MNPILKWRMKHLQLLMITAGLALAASAPAQSDALLDKLVQKGILTSQEANDLRSETATNTPDGGFKFKMNKAIKSMELFGDFRLRYEYRAAQIATTPGGATLLPPGVGNTDSLNRFRYALRLGVRGDLVDDFYYGFRFETSPNPRSPWNTFGGASGSQSPYQGPFSKANNYGLFVGQAYLGWREGNWLDLSLGRVPQPLYTTPMVWDSDYCPEGAVEKINYTSGNAGFFLTMGQFLYQDANPTTGNQAFGVVGNTPSSGSSPWLLAWQAGLTYRLSTNMNLKFAPVVYNYVGHGNAASGFYGPFVGQGMPTGLTYASLTSGSSSGVPGNSGPIPAPVGSTVGINGYNQTGINNLFILDFPAELNFKLGRYDAKLFGDFAVNLEGDDRARAAYSGGEAEAAYGASSTHNPTLYANPFPGGVQLGNDKAYQAGLSVGNNVGLVYGTQPRKGTWETRVYWQHVEQYALDPNLLDSDFFEGRGNLQGIYAAFSYSVSDAIMATVRYGHAGRINNNLGTGGFNADMPLINPVNKYDLVQIDLTLRF
ncbi:MAG TPA: putative porin [Verrucomicrobiae bacterium]|nr:putative porin [Verrucomicrobiae bacterium]